MRCRRSGGENPTGEEQNRLFFRKSWPLGANVLLASQAASMAIQFHATGAEKKIPVHSFSLASFKAGPDSRLHRLVCGRADARTQVLRRLRGAVRHARLHASHEP